MTEMIHSPPKLQTHMHGNIPIDFQIQFEFERDNQYIGKSQLRFDGTINVKFVYQSECHLQKSKDKLSLSTCCD